MRCRPDTGGVEGLCNAPFRQRWQGETDTARFRRRAIRP